MKVLLLLLSVLLAGVIPLSGSDMSGVFLSDDGKIHFSSNTVTVMSDEEDEDTLILTSEVEKGAWLGVQISDLDREARKELDTKARYGAVIEHVLDDTPAERAGLEPSDIIIGFNGEKIRRSRDLTSILKKHKAEDEVELSVVRGDQEIALSVILGSRPKTKKRIKILGGPDFEWHGLLGRNALGIRVQELNPDLADYFKVDSDAGVLITDVDDEGSAAKAGLKAGDVLLSVAGEAVKSAEDIADILEDYQEGDEVTLEIVRKGSKRSVQAGLQETDLMEFDEFEFTPFVGPDFNKHYLDAMRNYRKALDQYRDLDKDAIKEKVERELQRSMREKDKAIQRLEEELQRLQEQQERLQEEVERLQERIN